jgi:Protein of unknown function (DUF2800)
MITIKALERTHSPLSPSSFERVSSCTMSHKLTADGFGRPVASEDAALGTAAHALFEWALRTDGELEQVESITVEGRRFRVDDRMRAAVQVALDWIAANLAGRELLIEHQVTLPWGRVSGWLDVATADAPFIVVDFKHGFHTVDADTPQIGLYILALLLERRGSIEGSGEATAIVIQPRALAEPVRTHTWTFAALRALRDRLIDTLDKIRRGDLAYRCASSRSVRPLPAVTRTPLASRAPGRS